MKTRRDLAFFLNVPVKKLTFILYKKGIEEFYTSFSIPKKNGESRLIESSKGELKALQKKLSNLLCEYERETLKEKNITINISHAFTKNKSIRTNALIHSNKKFVFNTDIENFFNSIHFGRIVGFFEKNRNFKFPKVIAVTIAQIACYKGHLPQGAPSSPIITNLICKILDFRLLKTAKKYKLDYTRYADDLTFSTNNKNLLKEESKFEEELRSVVSRSGFRLNDEKTRLSFKSSRQEVTGLTVNDKVDVNRDFYKKTRAMAYSLYKNGKFTINGTDGTINQLEGRFSFIDFFDRKNNKINRNKCKINNKQYIKKLNCRERESQKFLFYKHFWINPKPLIITEGKTDKVYLRAALKNLYAEYPKLITKEPDGKFEFNISFLKRGERLTYFFDLDTYGADSISKLYNYFSGTQGKKNYVNYFKKLTGYFPSNPTFLLFDNELLNKKKKKEGKKKKRPLPKFIESIQCQNIDKIKEKLKNECYFQLQPSLFLTTLPLPQNCKECEIEDLFDKKTLNHKIGGKSFSRDENANTNLYYGKNIFSKYIDQNYQNIDFKNFKPLFNYWLNIIQNYRQ